MLWIPLLVLSTLVPQEKRDQSPPAPATPRDAALTKLIDQIGQRVVEKEGVPGLTIAVAKDGAMLATKSFGYADAARGAPQNADTRYPLGTLTRQFTAVGILQLVEAKKLALDDEIAKLLPGFPRTEHKITVQHLLSNTSGLPSWTKLAGKHPQVLFRPTSADDFVKLFVDVPFDFEPGASFALDEPDYVLLSLVLAKVSGETYPDYVKKHILEPAQLTTTDVCSSAAPPMSFAADCKEFADARELELLLPAVPPSSAQSLCSTAKDLVRWQDALGKHLLLDEKSSELMSKAALLADGKSSDHGFAIALGKLEDVAYSADTGRSGGFRVRLAYYPDQHVTCVVLANCASARVDEIERELARFVLGLPEPVPLDLPLPPEEAARCTGGYQIATTRIHIGVKDGKLVYETPTDPPVPMRYQGPKEDALVFVLANDANARITFHIQDGKADSFDLYRNGLQSKGTRMD